MCPSRKGSAPDARRMCIRLLEKAHWGEHSPNGPFFVSEQFDLI